MTIEAKAPGLHALDIIAANGVPFRVLLILDEDAAPNPRRANGGVVVEFHDRRFLLPHQEYYPGFSEHGQFTGGYYDLDTMLDRKDGGLNLDGGVEDWKVDAATMALVMTWLRRLVRTLQL